MKKNLLFIVGLTILLIISHYFGVHRGGKATSDALSIQLSQSIAEKVTLKSALLISIKNDDRQSALKMANQLLEQDVNYLSNMEEVIDNLDIEKYKKHALKSTFLEARAHYHLAVQQ